MAYDDPNLDRVYRYYEAERLAEEAAAEAFNDAVCHYVSDTCGADLEFAIDELEALSQLELVRASAELSARFGTVRALLLKIYERLSL